MSSISKGKKDSVFFLKELLYPAITGGFVPDKIAGSKWVGTEIR
jgi:hypothetical protein